MSLVRLSLCVSEIKRFDFLHTLNYRTLQRRCKKFSLGGGGSWDINCKIDQKSLVYFSHIVTFDLFTKRQSQRGGGEGETWHNVFPINTLLATLVISSKTLKLPLKDVH